MAERETDDRRKEEWVDEGETIVDMSAVPGSPLSHLFSGSRAGKRGGEKAPSADRPWETGQQELTPEEQRSYSFGVIRAVLLVGLIYFGAAALLIIILIAAWT